MSKKYPGQQAADDPEAERLAVFRVEIPFWGKASHGEQIAGKLAREMQLTFGPDAIARYKKGSDPITPVEE